MKSFTTPSISFSTSPVFASGVSFASISKTLGPRRPEKCADTSCATALSRTRSWWSRDDSPPPRMIAARSSAYAPASRIFGARHP